MPASYGVAAVFARAHMHVESSINQYAVKSAIFSGCESHPANRSLGRKQPERRTEVTTCVEVLW